MTALSQLSNCQNCREDNHNECEYPDRCKCAYYKHSDNLFIGVKLDKNKPIDHSIFHQFDGVDSDFKKLPKLYLNSDWDVVASEIQSYNFFLTLRENKKIWYYNKSDGFYKPFGDTIIEEYCQRMIEKCTNKTVKEVVETIKRNKTMIDSKQLFESIHINTQNGILDPKTFELKPHSPEYYTISKLPFSINHNARNLKLWRHILTIIDVKDIKLLMELIWICISGNNPFKKMFVFKGPTNTQKSTLADILVWIIGHENVSRERPAQYLSNKNRFSTSKFIGKRVNIASEIGNLTDWMIENQKSLIGAELQNTERKSDNTERHFDPNHFVFLYTTNNLGKIYSTINDNSIITRYQFIIFRNQLDESKTNGQWYDEFFKDQQDKQSAIDTIVNIVINYKKAQSLGKIPKTKWSNIAATKKILDEEMPIEDKYFKEERIISISGSKLTVDDIKKDFEEFVGYKLNNQEMGNFMRKHGFNSSQSNSRTVYKGYGFANTKPKQQTLEK
ncbi:MAG: hypothetical protein QQN45_07550 [Nitrosopumilus sp.]